jgi:hypothetical protein
MILGKIERKSLSTQRTMKAFRLSKLVEAELMQSKLTSRKYLRFRILQMRFNAHPTSGWRLPPHWRRDIDHQDFKE